MIFTDGTVMSFSTHTAYIIDVNITWIIDYIKTKGRKITDIVLIVHNHFGYPRFSRGDLLVLNRLRKNGFAGNFCVYLTDQKKTMCIKDRTWKILLLRVCRALQY